MWSMGDYMSKQGEKKSTLKNNIFMKKYERIYSTYMVFAVFSINWVFGTVSKLFFLIIKKRPFSESAH